MFPSDHDVPADGFTFPPLGITEEELVEGQLEVPVPDSEDADNEVLEGNTPIIIQRCWIHSWVLYPNL